MQARERLPVREERYLSAKGVIEMILIRDVFQAKYGKGGELVQLFKEAQKEWTDGSPYGNLLLTDLSGPFFTVVTETRAESLAEWQQHSAAIFARPAVRCRFGRM